MDSLERSRISQYLGSFEMGQMTQIKLFLIIGAILDGSTSAEAIEDVLVSSQGWVHEEKRLLCEELEGEKYDQNRTLWKTMMLPAETLLWQKGVRKLIGFFPWSESPTLGQVMEQLTEKWVDEQFDKLLQQKARRNKKPVLLERILSVKALIVVDKALDKKVTSSHQFVNEHFLLVNHLVESIRIKIEIREILVESTQGHYGFIEAVDEEHGMIALNNPSSSFLREVKEKEIDYDIVLILSGLDICKKTGLLSQDFDCKVAGFAQKYVTGWPFYRSHNCAYKNAVIEVLNTSDLVPSPKWLTASTTAHEIAHLIGNTEHDGEEEFYGGGPGGGGCRGGAGQIMAPGRSITSLYRFCKDIDPWSECTIEQIKFYSDDWRQFCPGSFFTYHENPLYFYAPFYLLAALICINYAYRIYRIKQDIQHLRISRVQESDPDHQPQL